jgi:membrane protease YdiL (CAAX protease family)
VYAETFAIWLLLFVLLQIPAALFARLVPPAALGATLVAMLGSLLALAWPRRYGVAWSDLRHDVGLHLGGRRVEAALGTVGYLMTLPLLAVGLGVSLVLIRIDTALAGSKDALESAAGPSHPVVHELLAGDPSTVLQVLLLASIVAPLVEETMFRGVLYRHLRDASAARGRLASVALAGTLDAFLFAAIHPQGWVAIPALMALAWAFVLLREWRDSLVPAMIVHGISNGIVLAALLLVSRA